MATPRHKDHGPKRPPCGEHEGPLYQVHGTVTGRNGKELSNAIVMLWWQRIREPLLLAEGRTSEEGRYHLPYRLPDDAPGRVLLVVEARAKQLDAALASPVTPAQPDLQIDLHAQPRDPSEWDTLLRAIEPLLDRLPLRDVVESAQHRDITFLAQELNQSPEQIMRVVVAARLEVAYDVAGAVFFAFVRQRVPSTLPSPLLAASQDFTMIDALVARVGSLVFGLSPDAQARTLAAAVAQNLIGRQFQERIQELVDQLQTHRTTDLLKQPYLVGKATLGQLLEVAEIQPAKQSAFARALTENTLSMRNFWRTLGDGQHGFTAAEASAIERTLSVGAFVKNHVPLVQVLLQGFAASTYQSLSDLARLGVSDWTRLVDQVGPPASIDPAGTASPAEVFARVVYTRVTRAFPTVALASRLVGSKIVSPREQTPLSQFFRNNSDLDLVRHNLATYLEQQGDKAFAGIDAADRPPVVANARRMQRVLFVTPEVDAAETLLGLGLHSATHIAMMGRQQFFLSATNAGLSKRDANRVYETATQRYAGVVSLYTQFNRDAMGLWPKAVGNRGDLDEPIAAAIQRDQSLATLFGSQDYCATDSCTSILSPAAYLCDLLHWLAQRKTGAPSALDVLNDHRPDIGNLKLNCPNSETPLPYIDLVNEILADAISPPADPNSTINPPWKQTSENKTAADLRAAPEYFNQDAYVRLFGADYPHSLPYSEGLDELRAYLQQSGIGLWQLRQALLPLHNPAVAQQAAVAAERFHIAPHDQDLITHADFIPRATAWHTANPPVEVAPVPPFLHAAAITYEQLLQLLEAGWVQGGLHITVAGVNDLCDTSKTALVPGTALAADITAAQTTLTVASANGFPAPNFNISIGAETLLVTAVGGPDNTTWTVQRGQLGTTAGTASTGARVAAVPPVPLDVGFLDRAHRFLRLWRRTGYAMWELDLLLTSVAGANGTLDANGLASLFTFRQLQDATRLAVDQQLAFFQPLDTASHLDAGGRATTSLYDRVFLNPAIVSQHPDADLAAVATGGVISDPTLSNHLDAIQAALGISASDGRLLATLFSLTVPNTLTLANLSLLYGVTQLAGAARLSLADLLSVAPLINPAAANPTQAVAAIKALLASPAGVPNPADLAEAAKAVKSLLASPAATLAFLQQSKAAQQSGFTMDALVYLLTPPPWVSPTGLTDAGITTALTAVREAILSPSGGDVNGSVIAAVASQLGLANDVTAFLAQQLHVPNTVRTLISALTDASLTSPAGGPYPAINRANYPDPFLALQLLDKAGLVIKRLHLVLADLSWLVTRAGVYRGLDFAGLPVAGTQDALGLGPLLVTVLLVKLARLFTAAPPSSAIQTLYDLIGGVDGGTIANEPAAQAALATLTGWPLADITTLATALGVSFVGADYTQPATYEALRVLEAMIAAMAGKASGGQLVSWGAVPPDEPTAQNLAASALNVLKARYTNADWLKVAPPMIDPIREHRSAALQDYLIGNGDNAGHSFGDVNGLFDWFLIDTQMSSCEVTTRVIQAYIAVQIFVERCRMNLLAPDVVIDPNDDAWEWWSWMKRYRIWEAAREVFLYPENWLVESQRLNRTDPFQKLEQEVHQNEHTADYFETVALNYIDRLDGVAHLFVTGTCSDPATKTIHVVARSVEDPPQFYHRSLTDGAWTGWEQIPLNIKAHQVVPAVYRRRLCLFWAEVKVANEPRQDLPSAQPSSNPPSQAVGKYVSIALNFSIFRNGAWAPPQTAKGKLFDKPIPLFGDLSAPAPSVSDSRSVEALYSLKVQTPAPAPGYGAALFVDVFRLGALQTHEIFGREVVDGVDATKAVHLGRALFDGRFGDLELRNLLVQDAFLDFFGVRVPLADPLLSHAQASYGPDALPLLPLPDNQADPDLATEPGLIPQAGALATRPADPNQGSNQTLPLSFTGVPHQQNPGTLLNTAPVPFRVTGPSSDILFDATDYFFYQDNRRSYYVEARKYYWTGSAWSPVPPSDPATALFEERYSFHRFYHSYTRLLWHQLAGGGLTALYDQQLQLNPDQVDPSQADVFSFQGTYQPVAPKVQWGEDNEILDFSPDAAYSVYNWELFFHAPFYLAQLLSQNQQFEDAQTWFHYLFDPTRQSADPAPKRFWIPKPLFNLTSTQIQSERINNLLQLVNLGDPNALNQVARWRRDPFNPFLLADLRPVAYMKAVVMAYLDNLIAWADNLFATDSREALSEATLLYVIAAEILGPQPVAITPPEHADDSYNQLAPKLDAFSNALVEIENVLGQGGGGQGGNGGAIPAAQTFYFKIPSNDKLLGYWKTVADRLFKLRHCQNIQGVERQLALFDAPIDPGLLIKARAAGVDIGSVLTDLQVALPNYRFAALYPQALDFVNAVRAYGALLTSALEKRDADHLAVLLATNQQQLLSAADQIFGWQVEQAQKQIDNLNAALELAQEKVSFWGGLPRQNEAEGMAAFLSQLAFITKHGVPILKGLAAVLHAIPNFGVGVAGFGGSPSAGAHEGGSNAGHSSDKGSEVLKEITSILEDGAKLAAEQGRLSYRYTDNQQKATEAGFQVQQTQAQLAAAELALAIAQQNQTNHQTQADQLQQQIDFLTDRFTNEELYDWMVARLADTYFQSYKLAYRLGKQVERCYRYELGIPDSDFIQFGYWDSLHKGLLAGEALNHDLRRMQASYLDNNVRRFEISRYVSLATLNPGALQQLLLTGACDFELPESLFDHDYPGHYHRHLVRVSITVAYPAPGKFDNVKATLKLARNQVRTSADLTGGYAENPPGGDSRFVYNYALVPQQIVLGNGQDDPGLFLTAINNNLGDPRYLPFEGAGAISAWHLEMPAASNEIALNQVTDVILHLYYTALDGGDALKQQAQNNG